VGLDGKKLFMHKMRVLNANGAFVAAHLKSLRE
jgi:hypothetical protein